MCRQVFLHDDSRIEAVSMGTCLWAVGPARRTLGSVQQIQRFQPFPTVRCALQHTQTTHLLQADRHTGRGYLAGRQPPTPAPAQPQRARRCDCSASPGALSRPWEGAAQHWIIHQHMRRRRRSPA